MKITMVRMNVKYTSVVATWSKKLSSPPVNTSLVMMLLMMMFVLLRATYVWEPAAADDDDEDVHDNDGDLGDNCVGDDETPAQMIKTASCMNSLCVQALSLNQCD